MGRTGFWESAVYSYGDGSRGTKKRERRGREEERGRIVYVVCLPLHLLG